jgi:hypothetical protein
MADDRTERRETPNRGYAERVNSARRIHLRLDDGALLALCEDYRTDDPAPSPE